LGKSPLTGGQRYAYERISENRERRKENSEKEKAEISIKRPCRYSVTYLKISKVFLMPLM
jgi:hypothetical protein